MLIISPLKEGMAMTKATTETTTETTPGATTEATFENTYPRYPFAPLVELALMLASRIKATNKPADQTGDAPVLRQQRTASPGQA